MPNHIQNILTIVGSDELVKKINDFIRGTEPVDDELQPIDFNKILPMPEELNITSGGDGKKAAEYLASNTDNGAGFEPEWGEKRREEALQLGRAYIRNIKRYSAPTWYEWRLRHWGTKWTAYWGSISDDGREIWFSTAWNAPVPVIAALASKFPEAAFELTFADEDAGYNTGCVQFEDGEEVFSDYPIGDSDESWAYYFKTHPGDEEYYKKVDGEWKYVED